MQNKSLYQYYNEGLASMASAHSDNRDSEPLVYYNQTKPLEPVVFAAKSYMNMRLFSYNIFTKL